jgi:two-component system cell cycle response regulator DivK
MKALVIEDNENNRELISFILTYAGYSVELAKNGYEGLMMAQTELPDFIILDIQLPDIDGFEVLQNLRSDKKFKNIPIIVMSSYGLDGDEKKIADLGGNYYIEKPIAPETVMVEIENVLKIARGNITQIEGRA